MKIARAAARDWRADGLQLLTAVGMHRNNAHRSMRHTALCGVHTNVHASWQGVNQSFGRRSLGWESLRASKSQGRNAGDLSRQERCNGM